jgi:hypothetical protein
VRLTKKRWAEPKANWLPLRQAVFTFGMAADDAAADLIGSTPVRHPTPFSTRQLTQMLADRSGASKAEIDPIGSTFLFSFGAKGVFGGPPWAIVDEPRETAKGLDAWVTAEAVFNKEGFVSVDDKEKAARHRAVREATGLVWRQFILHAFDRAVTTGAVTLYARRQALSADFEQLPTDVWPLLEVVDWSNGMAIAADGTPYWSIHCRPPTTGAKSSGEKRGRKRKMDWDGVVKPKVFQLLDHHGWPDPSDQEWASQADVEAQVSAICGEEVSESTVRHYTVRFMAEWKRAKAGN